MGCSPLYYRGTWTCNWASCALPGNFSGKEYGGTQDCRAPDRSPSSGDSGGFVPGPEAVWTCGTGCFSGCFDRTGEFQPGGINGKIIKFVGR